MNEPKTQAKYNTATRGDRTSRILQALAGAPDGLTTYEIAAATSEDRVTIVKSMSTLTGSRRVIVWGLRRMEEGTRGRKPIYNITDAGRQCLDALPS